MARTRRHRRSVSLREFTELGSITVHPTLNLDQLEYMAGAQATFGGGMRGRLVPDRVGGKRCLALMVLYTSSRAKVAILDNAISRPILFKVRWLWFWNRVVTFEVAVDGDPRSNSYLDVVINPIAASVPVRDLSSPS